MVSRATGEVKRQRGTHWDTPPPSWPEIASANEVALAAHTAAEQHRFVAIPRVWLRASKSKCSGSNGIIVGSERWQSGRSHPPRKRAYLNGYREFESPPLRHLCGAARLLAGAFAQAGPKPWL
jgi:hypothetical protein